MNLAELKATTQALENQLRTLNSITPGCRSCEHFARGNECDVFRAMPPPAWIDGPVECEQWVWDGVPFITASMHFDMTSSKQRRMSRYDF